MYSLLSGLYKYLTRKEEYYVLVLGLDNAGKTIKSLFLGVPGLPPEKITPTVGLNIGKIDIGMTRINFWDLGGQTDLQTLWQSYYAECHAIIFMVDSTDKDRLQDVRNVFGTLAKGSNKTVDRMIDNDEVEGVPVVMLANKQDMEGALRVESIKEIFNQIAQRLSARESNVLAVSALRGEGVKEAVDWLYLRLQRNRAARPPVYK